MKPLLLLLCRPELLCWRRRRAQGMAARRLLFIPSLPLAFFRPAAASARRCAGRREARGGSREARGDAGGGGGGGEGGAIRPGGGGGGGSRFSSAAPAACRSGRHEPRAAVACGQLPHAPAFLARSRGRAAACLRSPQPREGGGGVAPLLRAAQGLRFYLIGGVGVAWGG
eukprot:gene13578-biopygen5286